jgi:hypothetical protein
MLLPMTKQIRLIVVGKDRNYVARVEITTAEFRVRARAIVEEHEPPLYYDTPYHSHERTALAEVATWLRSRCNASVACLATDGGVIVAITGDSSLRIKGDDPDLGQGSSLRARAG